MTARAKPLRKKFIPVPPLIVRLGRYLSLLILSGLAVYLILPKITTLAQLLAGISANALVDCDCCDSGSGGQL